MTARQMIVSLATLAAAGATVGAESMNIMPDLWLHGPDTAGRAYEAKGHNLMSFVIGFRSDYPPIDIF